MHEEFYNVIVNMIVGFRELLWWCHYHFNNFFLLSSFCCFLIFLLSTFSSLLLNLLCLLFPLFLRDTRCINNSQFFFSKHLSLRLTSLEHKLTPGFTSSVHSTRLSILPWFLYSLFSILLRCIPHDSNSISRESTEEPIYEFCISIMISCFRPFS